MAFNVPVVNLSEAVTSSGNSDAFSVDGAVGLHLVAVITEFAGTGSVSIGFELQLVDGTWSSLNTPYGSTSFSVDGEVFFQPAGPLGRSARVAWSVPTGVSFTLDLSTWVRV